MNQSQVFDFIKGLLATAAGAMIGHGASSGLVNAFTGDAAITFYTGAIMAVAPLVGGWFWNTASRLARRTTAVAPDTTVVVGPKAPADLKAVAADPSVTNIVKKGTPA